MAIEKNISSRIQHKHDIEANWLLAIGFTPKQGEIIVYDIDDTYSYERFKIGDGVQNVNDLPFYNDGFVSYNEQNLTDEQKAQVRANIDLPTKISEFENDSGYVTKDYVDNSIAEIPDCIYVHDEEPVDAEDGTLWLDTDEEAAVSGGGANIDVIAEVGQTIIVEEVDANGKPTKWKAVDFQEKICGSEEVEILPETTFIPDEEGLFGGEGLIGLGVGKTYKVNWNGIEYVCVAVESVDGNGIGIGNVDLAEGTGDTGEPFLFADITEDGIWMSAVLDGSTSVTLSITEVKYTPIPVEYVSNAFPYYINLAFELNEENRPTNVTCLETTSELEAIFKTGRSVVAKMEDSTGAKFYYLAGTVNTDYGMGYQFSVLFHNSGGGLHPSLIFVPNTDGTYTIEVRSHD